MKIGKLRNYLAIQENQGATRNEIGEPVDDWQTINNIWCQIKPRNPTEQWEAQQVAGIITHDITIRYRTLDHSWRFLETSTGRLFYIVNSIIPNDIQHFIIVRAREENTNA